jgi:hypothetical protein
MMKTVSQNIRKYTNLDFKIKYFYKAEEVKTKILLILKHFDRTL